jgi:hypothetical protein
MNDESERQKQQLATTTALSSNSNVGFGFDEIDPEGSRSIVGPFVKFVDGEWTISNGVPLDPNFRPLVIGLAHTLQCWKDNEKLDEIVEHPLPDVDDLNAAISQSEWGIGLDGKPRPPWSHTYKIFLLNPETGEQAVYANNTWGAKIAYGRLKDQVQWMWRMRGRNVLPRVKLTWTHMQTRFGVKKRPHLEVIEWVSVGEPTPPAVAAVPQPQPQSGNGQQPVEEPSLQKVEEPSVAEDLNDKIPF